MLFCNIRYVDEDFVLRENGFLGIEEDKVEYIGAVPPEKDYGRQIDGRDLLALPGLVNVHCHVPMVLMRGYGEGLPLHRWLRERIFPFEAKMEESHFYYGALLGIGEMLSHGITSFSDMYLHVPAVARAAWESGIRANIGFGVTGEDVKGQCRLAAEGARCIRELGSDRLRADYCLHAEYTSSPALVEALLDAAQETPEAVFQVHLSETEQEHREGIGRRGMTPAAYLDSLGFFGHKTVAAHCVWLEEGDMELLRDRGVSVAHCPKSNLKLGSGVAPVKKLLEKGVNVCVATDGAASNNTLDMLDEGKVAALLLKGANLDPTLGTPGEMLRMMTRNGALAQGRGNTGLIKVGYQADLAVFSMERAHWHPLGDPLAALLFAANSGDVAMTVVGGRVLYENGAFPTLDMERVKFEAKRARDQVLAALAL